MATGLGPPAGNRCRQEDDDNDRREQPPNPPIRPARPSVKPHDGGYDCEVLERPSSKLVQADCSICLLVLRQPHQVTCCGYSFCRGCSQRVRDAQNACPTCGEEIISYPNIGLKRTLRALIVRCSRRRLGCEWEGELGELDRHLNQHPLPEKLLVGCSFLRWSALSASSLSSVAISKLTSLMTAPSVLLHASIANSMKLPLRRLHRATGQCALPFLSPVPTTAT